MWCCVLKQSSPGPQWDTFLRVAIFIDSYIIANQRTFHLPFSFSFCLPDTAIANTYRLVMGVSSRELTKLSLKSRCMCRSGFRPANPRMDTARLKFPLFPNPDQQGFFMPCKCCSAVQTILFLYSYVCACACEPACASLSARFLGLVAGPKATQGTSCLI